MLIKSGRKNIIALRLFTFLDALHPLSILAMIWYYQITQSYALASTIFTIQIVSQGFFEIPSGVLSDRFSRVMNLRLSSFLLLLSYVLMALAGTFGTPALVVSSIIMGAGYSLSSGTSEAFIYEILLDVRKQDKFDIVFSKISGMTWQLGAVAGSGIAAISLLFVDLQTLIWISVLIGTVCFVSSFLLTEPHSRVKSTASSFHQVISSLKQMWQNKKLRKIVAIRTLGTGDSVYYIEGAYFANLISPTMIPMARLFRQLSGAFGFYIAPKIRQWGFFKILMLSSFGSAIVSGIAILMNNTITPFLSSATNIFFGTKTTANETLMQKEFTPSQRATMKNIQSFLSSISVGLWLIMLGFIADQVSIRVAMFVIVGVSFLISFLYLELFKKYNK